MLFTVDVDESGGNIAGRMLIVNLKNTIFTYWFLGVIQPT